jgi:toxin YoeB
MEVIFSPHALEDLRYWKQINDERILQRIRLLLENIQQDAFKGMGKPEPLKHNLKGMWSRRINQTHRIIYEVTGNRVTVHALKEHY